MNRKTKVVFAMILLAAVGVQAGTYTQNFNGVSSGSTDLGDGTTMANSVSAGYTSVYDHSGAWRALRLTQDGAAGQVANFALYDLDPGEAITSFSASFDVLIKDEVDNPADGFSFNFGALGSLPGGSEEGMYTGSGHMLSIGWDTYNNGDDPRSIEVFIDGVSIGNNTTIQPYIASSIDGANYRNVSISLDAAGLDVIYGGAAVFTDLDVSGFTASAGDRFGVAARTGGADEDVFIDNLSIITVPEPASLALLGLVSGIGLFFRRRLLI